jgi:thiopeptide-type bacteriocin biosynthesis protein
MPTDHLTHRADRIAALVEAVLAGAPAETTATEAGIHPADLNTAVQTYRAGGQAALQQAQDSAWFHARVEPVDWNAAEAMFRTRIAPRLDQLDDGQAGWWFLRKYPCWRLRIHTTGHYAVRALLDGLAAAGVIAGWKPGIYEPELAAFGGPVAMAIVHELFCADSKGVLAYTTLNPPPIGRRELSLLLIRTLQHHAGLDWFESADVFDRVARMRPEPAATDGPRIAALAVQMRPLLALPADAGTALFAPDGPIIGAASWLQAHVIAGQQLAEAGAAGRLDRGLRAVIAHLVIFNWNRLDLAAHSQAILARAATAAILPRS